MQLDGLRDLEENQHAKGQVLHVMHISTHIEELSETWNTHDNARGD